MNLDELRSALDTERQKGGLQGLRDSFYQEVAEFVEERKRKRDDLAAEAENPFGSADVQRLTNEIETARSTAESLYERRLGKLVKQASLAAADMTNAGQVDGLTEEEQVLYDDLVGRIEGNKDYMLDVIAGEAETTPPVAGGETSTVTDSTTTPESRDPPAESMVAPEESAPPGEGRPDDVRAAEASAVLGDDEDDGVSAADVMGEEPSADDPAADGSGVGTAVDDSPAAAEPAPAGGGSATGTATTDAAGTSEATAVERTTVRITSEVGEIFGVDEREYSLDADDVVTLPTANAEPLLEREAAERLE